VWDDSRKACESWECLQWLGGGNNDLDFYCSGVFNCAAWKIFAPSISTDKSTYQQGETINITGSVWDAVVNVTLDITDSDNNSVSGYPKNVTTDATGNLMDSLNSINLAVGTHTLIAIQANDSSKNDTTTFTVTDGIPPNITYAIAEVYDTPDPQSINEIVNITAIIKDNVNVSSAWVDINGTNYSMTNIGDTYYYEYTGVSLGTFPYQIFANDTVDNLNSTRIYNLTIADYLPPQINSVIVDPINLTIGQQTTITANVTDDIQVDTVIVQITYPNASKENFTMNPLGDDLYSYDFSNTNQRGFYYVGIYANDTSNNSEDTFLTPQMFFVIPVVFLDKSIYDIGETVYITGVGYTKNGDVTVDIWNASNNSVSGYPKTVKANPSRFVKGEWSIPYTQANGNYIVLITDLSTNITATNTFEITLSKTYPVGTLIIPMDKKQNTNSESEDFLRAYGMLWRFLNNSISVDMIITPPCYTMNGTDVNTSKEYYENYCHGFLMISDSGAWDYYYNTLWNFYDAGCGCYPFRSVTVHNLAQATGIKEQDVLSLNRQPEVLILEGSEDEITPTLDPSYIPYNMITEEEIIAGNMTRYNTDVLTIGHYDFDKADDPVALTDAIKAYVASGGDVHAECIGASSLDAYCGFIGNVVKDGKTLGPMAVIQPDPDHLITQTHRVAFDNEGGAVPTLDMTNAVRNYTALAVDINYKKDSNYVKFVETHYEDGYVTYAGGHLGDRTGGSETPRNRLLDNLLFYSTHVNDIDPPVPHNQGQSKEVATANDIVDVWSYWTDNKELSTAILSHNASGTWVNVSVQNLTGRIDYSSFSIDTSGLADGTVVAWMIYANDTGGNLGETGVMNFTIDAVAPAFNETEIRPQAGQEYNQTDIVSLVVSVSENVTVTANITYPDSTSTLVTLVYNGTEWRYTVNFTDTLIPGQYNVTFNATDIAGNSNKTTTYFIVDDITNSNVVSVLFTLPALSPDIIVRLYVSPADVFVKLPSYKPLVAL